MKGKPTYEDLEQKVLKLEKKVEKYSQVNIDLKQSERNEVGKATGMWANVRDISSRKKAENALKYEKEFTENLIETANAIVVTLDKRASIHIFNQYAEDLTGYKKAEVQGKNWFELFIPERDRKLIPKVFESVLSKMPETSVYENPIIRKDGTERLIRWSNNIIKRDKQIIGLLSIGMDITDQKSAENELKKLRTLLSNIIDSMPSALIGVDSEGKVIFWNMGAEKITKVKSELAKNKFLTDIMPFCKIGCEKVRAAITSGKIYSETNVLRTFEGKYFYEDITIYPLTNNEVVGAVIRIDDATKRVLIEKRMIQSEKMVAVGGLAAGMAHEINNPLAGIIQNSLVVLSRLTSDLPANQKTALEIGITMGAISEFMDKRGIISMLNNVCESGKRAAEIVRNMLKFVPKGGDSREPGQFPELLDRTIALAINDFELKQKYNTEGIEIIREYPEKSINIFCETSNIQQAILNLIRNSVEAMEEKMSVEGFRPQLTLRVISGTEEVRLEIEDNGAGIEGSILHRVFEPFFTTKETGKGTGLGLFVSYFIITENHKGTIQVESKKGTGTKFIIRLPLRNQ
jgi:PAS domain S-box-containing protein